MKYLLEYNSFLDTIDLADVTEGKNSRSQPLTEEQFMELFNKHCKNFNFNNTQLYRGVILKQPTDFFYINSSQERGEREGSRRAISGKDYNIRLSEEPQFKDLPKRNKAIIGSTNPIASMVTVGKLYIGGDRSLTIQEDRTFIMIPYDDTKICVSPVIDLIDLKRKICDRKFDRSDFKLIKYDKGFNIPGVLKNHKTIDGKEIWMEGECLLLRYSSLERFKELVEQNS